MSTLACDVLKCALLLCANFCMFLKKKAWTPDFCLKKTLFNCFVFFVKLDASVKQLSCASYHWAKTLSTLTTEGGGGVSTSVFHHSCCFKATLFAFSGQCPAVTAPYQLLSNFQQLSIFPQIDWVIASGAYTVLHAACSGILNEGDSLITNELMSCKQ